MEEPETKMSPMSDADSPVRLSPALFTDLYELTMAQAYGEHAKLWGG
jgi:nicotinic acid phosphoribosyltransferase